MTEKLTKEAREAELAPLLTGGWENGLQGVTR